MNEIVSYVNLRSSVASIHQSIIHPKEQYCIPSALTVTSENRKDYTLHDSKALNTSDTSNVILYVRCLQQVTLNLVSVHDYSL